MKPFVQKKGAFIAKSLLWSLLLYVTMMVAFNWDDVSNTMLGRDMITVVTNNVPDAQKTTAGDVPAAIPESISLHNGIAKNIVAALKIISGIAGHAAR